MFLGGRVSGDDLSQMAFAECLAQSARDRESIVDLRGVGLLDSSAIVALSPFFRSVPGTSGRVSFSGLTAEVRRMLQVAGLGEPERVLSDAGLLSVLSAEDGNDE